MNEAKDLGPRRAHGYSGYTVGCRCYTCRSAKKDYDRAARARVLADPNAKHGRRYVYDAGCRCDLCRSSRQRGWVEGDQARMARTGEQVAEQAGLTPADVARVLRKVATGTREWVEGARCSDADPELFFPRERDPQQQAAKSICRACPVRQQCLEWTLSQEVGQQYIYGIAGGLSANERRAIIVAGRRQQLKETA